MKDIDFTNCEVDFTRTYGGANGSKIGIVYNDAVYMIKFPPKPSVNKLISYTNSCISEYVSCQIINSLNIKAQETILGKYKDKIVVACRDFTEDHHKFADFGSLKNTVIDSVHNGYGTELNDILSTIENQKMIDKHKLLVFFWDMFIIDALLGNFDRHNGNWGFIINQNKDVSIAPIYDCGSCLFPQNADTQMGEILKDTQKIEDRVYSYPTSAIKKDNVRINYYNFLIETSDLNCLTSLIKIQKRINLYNINKIIDNTPHISEIHKLFLKTIIKERKEKILDKAILLNKNIVNNVK